MSRKLDGGIIKAFCQYCESTEVPDAFSLWVGTSIVSAVLGRDCFVDFGHVTIYPNLYIVLVAGSARCRKSTAIRIGRKFVEQVRPPIRILCQKMTVEGMIGALCGMDVKDESKVVLSASGMIVVDEMSTLIDKNSFKSGMISVLTRLYDCDDFDYLTRGRGIELVKNPCLSILGANTIAGLKDTIPIVSIDSGFTPRVIFIYKEKPEKVVPWPVRTQADIDLESMIHYDLCEVAKMRGQFGLTKEAKEQYKEEYVRFFEKSPLFNSSTLSGYAGRRHTTLLKVAMSISAARTDSREIDSKDIASATKALQWAEKDMLLIMRAISAEEAGTLGEEVLMIIMGRSRIIRSDLLKQMRHKLYPEQLDVIVDALEQVKAIKIEADGNRIEYVYVGKHHV